MPPRIASMLPEPLPLRDGVRVLEIGTGDGTTIRQVATWARELGATGEFVGLDREPSRAEPFAAAAREAGLGERTHFLRGDAFHLPPDLEAFDVLLCFECLSQFIFEALPAPVAPATVETRLAALLAHWRSVLAPGGRLVIADTDRDAAGDEHARGVALFEQERWPLLPSALVDAALRGAGFEALRTRSSLRQRNTSRDEMEQSMGAGRHRRLPRGNFPPPPFAPRVAHEADGVYQLSWRVVQAAAPAR